MRSAFYVMVAGTHDAPSFLLAPANGPIQSVIKDIYQVLKTEIDSLGRLKLYC
jgi:hypothetical protein